MIIYVFWDCASTRALLSDYVSCTITRTGDECKHRAQELLGFVITNNYKDYRFELERIHATP